MADFMGLMKQAAQLQSKMQALQAELDLIEVEGTAGGGMVTVTLTAKGDMKGTKIDDSLMKPGEKEILEDLLVAAHADARVTIPCPGPVESLNAAVAASVLLYEASRQRLAASGGPNELRGSSR